MFITQHLRNPQDLHGWLSLENSSNSASGVGTTFLEPSSCTTPTSSLHPKATSIQLSATRRSSTPPLWTTTFTILAGTILPGSTHTPSPSTTPPTWSAATPPLPENSIRTIPFSTWSIFNSLAGVGIGWLREDGALGAHCARMWAKKGGLSQGRGLRGWHNSWIG